MALFEGYEESRDASFDLEGSSGTRVFVVPYADRHDLDLVAGVSKFTDGLGWGTCPEDALILKGVNHAYEGARDDSETEAYKNEFSVCRITAKYVSSQFVTGIWKYKAKGELDLLQTGYGLKWADGTMSDQSNVIPIPKTCLDLSRTFVWSQTQQDLLISLQGHTNDGELTAPWGSVYADEGLLYLNADVDDWWDFLSGTHYANITFHFVAKTSSHNVVWREPAVQRDFGGNPMYDTNGRMLFHGVGSWVRYETDPFPAVDLSGLFTE